MLIVAAKKSVVKYVGVYYTESKTRKWLERPDRVFWVNFKDANNGKLHWERCGWASEGWTAEAAQKRRYELLNQERTGQYKPKRERVSETITFGKLMDVHYLPWADGNKKRARDDRSLYNKWLAERFKNTNLQEVSSRALEDLKTDMRKAGKAEATVKHALCLVRQAFNKAKSWKLWNGENPCKEVVFPKLNNARTRFLNVHDVEKLLTALREQNLQLYQIATLGLTTGCRLREIFSLKWSNIDFAHGYLTVLDSKKSKSRPIPLTKGIKEILDQLPAGNPSDTLFKNSKGEQIGWLSKEFKSVVDSVGLNDGITDRREKVSFHSLRHTYASWAVMSGVPLFVVGRAMGHATTVMTERYGHLAPGTLQQAFQAVEDFRNGGAMDTSSDTDEEE
jgi:integrase